MSTSSLQPTAGSPSTVLDVYPSSPQHALSAAFYSLFLETEINFGGEGGLLADQIWNGDLEALGRDDWSRPTEDGGRSSLELRRTQLRLDQLGLELLAVQGARAAQTLRLRRRARRGDGGSSDAQLTIGVSK